MAKKPTTQSDYVVVRSPLDHDGEVFAPGEPVSLSETQAAPLLAVGAIEAAPATDKKSASKE